MKMSTTMVYAYGLLPPDLGLAEVEEQMRMRFRYRRLLTLLARMRQARERAVYGRHPALSPLIDRVDRWRRVYAIALDVLRDAKRNRDDGEADDSPRRRQFAAHHDMVVTRLREAERDLSAGRKAVTAAAKGRPPEFATATKEQRAEALAAEAFARWVIAEPRFPLGGPNSTTRREAYAAESVARWVIMICRDQMDIDRMLLDGLDTVERCHRMDRLDARHAVQAAGLVHGNYSAEDDDFADADEAARKHGEVPHCPRRDRDESCAVQIQGGMSADDLLGGEDTRLRLVPRTGEDLVRPNKAGRSMSNPSKLAMRYRVWLRVGSNGRAPVWASAKAIMHRPLPEGATIMRARMHRVLQADRWRWSLQLTVTVPEAKYEKRPGVVAVNLGWRRHFSPDGDVVGVRVAKWRDDAGQTSEVRLPWEVHTGLELTDRLRGIRDRRLDRLRNHLLGLIRDPDYASRIPGAVLDAARGLWQWRAPRRFVSLLRVWERVRIGVLDWRSFGALAAWARRDRHLWRWQEDARGHELRRRKDAWRSTAARLAQDYGTIVLHEFDLTDPKIAERPGPSELIDDDRREQRKMARRAAPGDLRMAIRAAAKKYGARIDEKSAVMLTQTCSTCGENMRVDTRPQIEVSCGACSAVLDQDDNACINLLAIASGKVLPTPAGPLADGEIAGESSARKMRGPGGRKAPRRDRSKPVANAGGIVVDVG
jgi:ribosomal protein S27E